MNCSMSISPYFYLYIHFDFPSSGLIFCSWPGSDLGSIKRSKMRWRGTTWYMSPVMHISTVSSIKYFFWKILRKPAKCCCESLSFQFSWYSLPKYIIISVIVLCRILRSKKTYLFLLCLMLPHRQRFELFLCHGENGLKLRRIQVVLFCAWDDTWRIAIL